MSNPLRYSDPSGESFWSVLGSVFYIAASIAVTIFNPALGAMMIGAYVGGALANKNMDIGKWDFNNYQTYIGIIGGAVAGLGTVSLIGAAMQNSLAIKISAEIGSALKATVDFAVVGGKFVMQGAGWITAAGGGAYMTYSAAKEILNGYRSGQGGYSGDNIFLETWTHYQIGGRKDLNVSTSSLDFSFVSKKNLAYNSKDNTYSVNLFSLNKFSQTSLALGKVSLNSIGNNRYTINRDYYDFNIEWSQGFSTRNIGTFGAGLIHGPVIDNIPVPLPIFPLFGPSVYTGSGSYWINFSGSVYIKP